MKNFGIFARLLLQSFVNSSELSLFKLFFSPRFPFFTNLSFFRTEVFLYRSQSLQLNYFSIGWDFFAAEKLIRFFTFLDQNKNTSHFNTKKGNFLASLNPTGENRLITVSRRSQLITEWMKSFLSSPASTFILCYVKNNRKTVYCACPLYLSWGRSGHERRAREERVKGERNCPLSNSPSNHCVMIASSQIKLKLTPKHNEKSLLSFVCNGFW